MSKNLKLQAIFSSNLFSYMRYIFILISWLLCFLSISILFIYTWSEYTQIYYCLDEETAKKLAEETARKVTNNDNFGVHVHNPNINVTNNWGKAASNLGIGGAVSAGIYAVSQQKRVVAAPVGVKAGAIALGGIMGGFAFATSSALNTRLQNSLESNNSSEDSTSSTGTNGPYGEASSMIDKGDGINEIMNFLYSNLFVGVCILFLLVILLYLYKNYRKKELFLFILWISLLVISLLSIYLAYNLTEDIYIISRIYQENTNKSVVNYKTLDSSVNQVEETMKLLYGNLGITICIFYGLILLIALFINTKIIKSKWEFTFIKNIFGSRYHRYFMKVLTFTSKSNELWMYIIWTILILGSLFSIYIAYSLIEHIDIITELYQYYKK